MITGLEPLLAPALAKCAGAGVARAGGWAATQSISARRRRKIRALTHSKARAAQLQAIVDLDVPQFESVTAFCASPEIEHFCTALARAYLLEGSGKASDKFFESLRYEFSASLELWIGEPPAELLSEALFSAVSEAVLHEAENLLDRPKLSQALEAELIATAGSLAAASVRNTELLTGLETLEDIREFSNDYRNQVGSIHGTMRLPHAGTTRTVPYKNLFVEPRVLATGADLLVLESVNGQYKAIPVEEMVRCNTRLVILGDPGGGKSTLSRKLMYDLAVDDVPEIRERVPFFVELRDYAPVVRGAGRLTLVEYLEGVCRSPYNLEAPAGAIEYLLLNDLAVVILDGLDELLDVSLRRDVVQAVEGFAFRYPTCPMVVTSRRVGYDEAPLDDRIFTKVGLSEFNSDQVLDYVNKWFTLDESVEESTQAALARSFVADSEFVSDLRVNPLMLSLMCGIYASEHYIPRNRPDVYEKCALLLFERWDKQRGIVPALSFDAHVQAALRALALHMFKSQYFESPPSEPATPQQLPGNDPLNGNLAEGIPRQELVDYLKVYLREKRFDTDEAAETAAVEFIDFCKGRAWVLTDVGAETYGFTHRTFLEYFAASQLVRLNTSATTLYEELRNDIERGSSDVVAQLAVQILGKATEDGADDFLSLILADSNGSSTPIENALSFAARSLTFIVPRPEVLKGISVRCAELYMRRSVRLQEESAMTDLMGCSAENAPRVASALQEWLTDAFSRTRGGREGAALLAFLPPTRYPGRATDYWVAWANENFSRYSEYLPRLAAKYFWVAMMCYERDRITVSELINMHGVGALYSYDMGGQKDWPPLVYRFFKRPRRNGFFGLGGDVSARRTRQIAEDLLTELPTRAAPWFEYEADFQSTAMFMEPDVGRASNRWSELRVLTALPLLEHSLVTREGDSPPHLHPLLVEAFELRRRGGNLRDGSDLNRVLSSHSTRRLVNQWLCGEISLLGTSTPARQRASPRPTR